VTHGAEGSVRIGLLFECGAWTPLVLRPGQVADLGGPYSSAVIAAKAGIEELPYTLRSPVLFLGDSRSEERP